MANATHRRGPRALGATAVARTVPLPRRAAAIVCALASAALGPVCVVAQQAGERPAVANGNAVRAPMRRAIVGRVDGAGGPIAGAVVTWIGHHTGALSDDAVDVVTATTDASGRYRANVIAGMPYFGFATGAWNEGEREASTVRGWHGAGAVVDFACMDRVQDRTVEVRGLDAWKARGFQRLVARPVVSSQGPTIDMLITRALDASTDGALHWPALPLGHVELLGADGVPLWASAQTVANMNTFAIEPPSEFECECVDEQGAPVVGASIGIQVRGRYDSGVDGIETTRMFPVRELARTGDDGRARFVLPLSGKLLQVPASPARMFVARAAGFGDQFCGARGRDVFVDGERVETPPDRLRFTMQKAEPIVGVVRLPDAMRASSPRVQLRYVGKLRQGAGSFLHDARTADAAIADDGSFRVHGVSADVHESQWAIQPSPHHPMVMLPRRSGLVGVDQLERELPLCATASLEVFAPDAGPAAGQCVYARRIGDAEDEASPVGSDPTPRDLVRFVTDGGGRVRASLAAGRWTFVTVSDRGFGHATTAMGIGFEGEVVVRMRPFVTMRGVVQDADGRPIEGASFVMRSDWQRKQAGSAAGALLDRWMARIVPPFAQRVRSAKDGSFSIDLPWVPEADDAEEQEAKRVRDLWRERTGGGPGQFSVLVSAKGKRTTLLRAEVGDKGIVVVLR